jgi:hypothetical protein
MKERNAKQVLLSVSTGGKGRESGHMQICFYTFMKIRTLKPIKIILSRGRGMANDGGGEPDQGTL